MLDICRKVDRRHKVTYVWFDTGLEYFATKNHLIYLTKRYGINLQRVKAIKPIPTCCKEYGQPFLSKFVSGMIEGLQRHGFDFKDYTFKQACDRVPMSYAKWWTNSYESKTKMPKQFNIGYNRWLKEFMLENPPQFRISSKCCKYAKKDLSRQLIDRYQADLMITGVRKSEGGIRNFAYKSCFDVRERGADFYRPIFWYKNEDKSAYENLWRIVHSDCYSTYGLTRTGCAGCPYNRNVLEEMEEIGQYEPALYKAVQTIFKDSYEYTKKYRSFAARMKGA